MNENESGRSEGDRGNGWSGGVGKDRGDGRRQAERDGRRRKNQAGGDFALETACQSLRTVLYLHRIKIRPIFDFYCRYLFMKRFDKIKKFPLITVLLVTVLLLSVVLLWINYKDNTQSTAPLAVRITFQGEYRIADGEFQPLVKGEKISASKGDLTLRGYFQIELLNGEVIGRAEKDCPITMYFNHIGGTIYVPGQDPHCFDAENPYIGKDACGQIWIYYRYVGTDADTVTIVLNNPHTFGNVTAYNDFLDNMYVYSGNSLQDRILDQDAFQRIMGFIFVVVGFVLFGVALYTALLHLTQGSLILHYGLLSFFAGGYFLFGVRSVSLWSEVIIFNTSALFLCSMLYELFLCSFAVQLFSGKMKATGKAAVGISGTVSLILIGVSAFSDVLFYDLKLLWGIVQSLVNIVVFILIILCIRNGNGKNFPLLVPCAISVAASWLDFAAAAFGWWGSCAASKIAFVLILLVALILILKVIPKNIRASMREKELIAERNALQLELQKNRESIMLSQIQPHFLYNTLNTIYYLCGKDAKTAQNAISSFSDYLRENLDSLDSEDLVVFEKELHHVKTYLQLEQIRFDEELKVVYDIQTTAFLLPILTVQPLVENAVKHGISKKRGGGSVTVATREHADCYAITVSDTGVGFDTEEYMHDGKKHVGIENVRRRLQTMCGGTLSIVSAVGNGTTATVIIPKKEAT